MTLFLIPSNSKEYQNITKLFQSLDRSNNCCISIQDLQNLISQLSNELERQICLKEL